MKILFDQGTPVPLRHHLAHHDVSTAFELGWSTYTNGDLLEAAEDKGFGILVTTDQNLKYQQNIKDRNISIVVLQTTSWPRIKNALSAVVSAIDASVPGGFIEVACL